VRRGGDVYSGMGVGRGQNKGMGGDGDNIMRGRDVLLLYYTCICNARTFSRVLNQRRWQSLGGQHGPSVRRARQYQQQSAQPINK